MSRTMRAARLHTVGEPLRIDEIEVPVPRPTDVLVEVKACGIVPNLGNVLNRLYDFPILTMPKLPAIFGLDTTGVVVEKGAQAHGIDVGDRVYVNPARYCGGCRECRVGQPLSCSTFTFNGYFGFSKDSQVLFDDYPYGGLSEFMTAPMYSLVKLPDNVPYETAARWGYLGTGYRAVRRAGVGPGSTLLVNGISGTLGLGVALFALALGARRILGTGRDRALLERVRAIDPERIEVHSVDNEEPVADWARRITDGDGVSAVIDALYTGTPKEPLLAAMSTLRRGGIHVNIGGVTEHVPIDLFAAMSRDHSFIGSTWFTTADGQEMADMAATGQVDLSVFEHEIFKLADVNDALALLKNRHGGFSNYVICP
ncbi:alcohol dehydrogenase catalytic domain-containing protein [Mycobacterium sp.]|uniref:alcohol dehydrogenase catalytic domain-containing protein n=1 Tax=Mycobacterium sp. TaxID=1785 RepID=UPI002CB8614A|nr:alcohol dehydrogenase catalytic domain-containing protein [Mycobacterium sp.]HKP42993.1 alcohol dehydrogenase catalytic domain-containing protein [Mycobacterium sp.]